MLGPLCEECLPRSRYGDGLICRDCAARLGGVLPDTISAWATRETQREARGLPRRLHVHKDSGGRPWYQPAEIIQLEWDKHRSERARNAMLLSLLTDAESVA